MVCDADAAYKRHRSIHDLSIKIVKDWSSTTKAESGPLVANLDREKLLKKIFKNYRAGRGLRLSKFGFDILSRKFSSYTSELKEAKLAVRTHLFLDYNATLPYYLVENGDDTKLVLFDENMAALLKLCGQDINSLPDQWI